MNATETKAKEMYDAYMKADIEFLFGRGPEPKKEDYGYRHGWIVVDGKSFPAEKWYPNNQPYMD